jgi:hypothetical protein
LDIHYLSRSHIDTNKWDKCIAYAVNGTVYGYSWFLDIVAPNWGALVGNDYHAVLPLVKGVKNGIDIIFQPNFARYLGLFSPNSISNELVNVFFNAIPKSFRYIEMNLNPFFNFEISGAETIVKSTYNIDLTERGNVLSRNYSEATKNILHRVTASGIKVFRSNSLSQFLSFIIKTSPYLYSNQNETNLIKSLVSQSLSMSIGEIYGAYTARNELCAAAFFIKANKKNHCLILTNNSEGIENNALYAVVDSYCNANAETNSVLEFDAMGCNKLEGMFLGFGMTATQYKSITINRLPWLYKKIGVLNK